MNSGCIDLAPAGQTAPDGLALVVQDLQSQRSFYQWTTVIAAAVAAGLYFYPRHKGKVTEQYGSARAKLNRHRANLAKKIMPLGGPEGYV